MRDLYRPEGVSGALIYRDPKAAYRWLEDAFGLEPLFAILDPAGTLVHAEMAHGQSVIMLGTEWSASYRSPQSLDGKASQSLHVQLAQGASLEAHCERARTAGATILMEPETQFYGDRSYRAADPEFHPWTFSITVQRMTPAQWDQAGGGLNTIMGRL